MRQFTLLLLGATLAACVAAPPRAPLTASDTLADFRERRLDAPPAGLPPPAAGWDRAQWLKAALELNPALAAQRAEVAAVAAGERTAAEHRNPSLDLFAEYLTSAAQSGAWLYGLSLDFLLQPYGERTRRRERAALETALAQSDLAESIWQVRAALRQALLDAAAAQDEARLLASLSGARQALLDTDRARVRLGEIARPQLLADETELTAVRQRRGQAEARRRDALARLAAAVGVPASAVDAVPVRWADWAAIGELPSDMPERWRTAALISRPQIVRALREYDLAENGLAIEAARRWPQVQLTPAYAWGAGGAQAESLEDVARESALGVSFELPLLNQHQGAIGEALARRAAAGERLKAAQAQIYEQIDRAERAWPAARAAWQEAQQLATLAGQQLAAEQGALAAGASDRAELESAQIAATEARLTALQAAYAAEVAFGALEDACRRPLQGTESDWPPGVSQP
ncbi:MAG TPA: TolC family protein [Steroidobacteraceae bacterium]|nr:TolC family protein [Steroidobacteraceae bacterium]